MKLLLLLVFFSLLTGFEVTFGDENGGVLEYRRAENIPGLATKPYVTSREQTNGMVVLKCEVRDASPKPKLHWQDSDGNILHAKEPQMTERGGHYDIILQTTVTKTDNYRCVATQEIRHQIYADTHVSISGGKDHDRTAENIPGGKDHDRTPENITGSLRGWLVAVIILGVVVFLGVAGYCVQCICCNNCCL